MIPLLLSWCFAFPAYHDPITNEYAAAIGFSAPAGAPRIWSTTPISATVVYSDTTDSATISLRDSLALVEQDGVFGGRSAQPFTLYLCDANTPPRVLWMPVAQT